MLVLVLVLVLRPGQHPVPLRCSMQEDLTRMQPLLEESRVRTEVMMGELENRKEKANEVRNIVAAQESEASEQQMVAAALQVEAKRDLDEALPELQV